jgi:hypothetical protein
MDVIPASPADQAYDTPRFWQRASIPGTGCGGIGDLRKRLVARQDQTRSAYPRQVIAGGLPYDTAQVSGAWGFGAGRTALGRPGACGGTGCRDRAVLVHGVLVRNG